MPDSLKRRLTAGWDLAAAGYDRANAHFVALGARLAGRAALFPGDRVLDVACGSGAVALAAAGRVAPEGRVVGVDLSAAMLAQARAYAQAAGLVNVSFAQMEAEALAFADESFSAALSGLGLFYLPDLARGLGEIARVLQPGGRLAFTAFGRGFLEPVNHLLAARMLAYDLPRNPLVKQMSWEPDALKELVEGAGFFMVRAALEPDVIILRDAAAWWDLLWHGAFRAFAYDADGDVLARFREEHLAEVAPLVGPGGLRVNVPVITVHGVRA